ncbi:MAG: ribonuclease P protein component [Phormidesmis sp.]
MALPKQHRLGSNRDFNKVHRKGLRASTSHLAMRAVSSRSGKSKQPPKLKPKKKIASKGLVESAGDHSSALSCAKKHEAQSRPFQAKSVVGRAPTEEMPSQFGISISKKVSKRAVVRNRIKRQIKAVLQQQLPAMTSGWQVVIVVRPSAVECEFADFLRELEYLLKKLRITDTHS